MGFIARLKQLRDERGWTQEDLAEKLKISRNTVAGYENYRKRREPGNEMLVKIADAFGVTTDHLLGRDMFLATALHDLGKRDQRFLDLLNALEDSQTQLIAAGRPLTPDQRVNLIRALDPDKPAAPIAQVPIVATIRAGIPILTDDHISGHLDLAADTRADFAVQITGDSMLWAGIHEGDYALCRESEAAHTGQMVVAAVGRTGW